MSRIIKNNKAYDSGDVDVFIEDVPLDAVELSYGTDQEHQVNHTLHNDATSWSMGKITHTATMTLMMHDITPIEKAAPDGDILKIKPFTVTASFINDYNVPVVDSILVKFKNKGREVTGDMGLNKQYELFAIGIDYNN